MPSAVPRARVAPAPQRPSHAIALGTPAPSNCAGRGRTREPTQWPHAGDRYRATHRALPARLPSYADYILRLQDTEPESLEIMLHLLLVALPLVVASPAAFNAQGVEALQFEVQSPLQIEVRSPPESRPHLPAATRDQHNIPATAHSTPHAHHPPTARAHHNARAAALERGQDDPPHDLLCHQPLQAQRHQPTIRRCLPGRPPRRSSFSRPCRCAREAGAHAAERTRARLCARVRRPFPRLPRLRAGLRATQLAPSTCERAASPVLLTSCALLHRCRQPQMRTVGLESHRAFDISATTGRRDVDTTVTPPSRPGGAKPVPVKLVSRSSSRLRPRRRPDRPAQHRVRSRRFRPGHRRHDRHSKHHRGLVGA
jgi:hypothetical protein